jgi:hypothetical protein
MVARQVEGLVREGPERNRPIADELGETIGPALPEEGSDQAGIGHVRVSDVEFITKFGMIVDPSIERYHASVGKDCWTQVELGSFVRDGGLKTHANGVPAAHKRSVDGVMCTRLPKLEHLSLIDIWAEPLPETKLNAHGICSGLAAALLAALQDLIDRVHVGSVINDLPIEFNPGMRAKRQQLGANYQLGIEAVSAQQQRCGR